MIIIDGEFTGLDPKKHGLISLGAVEFKNPKNQFYGECRLDKGLDYTNEALEINGFSVEEIFDKEKDSTKEMLIKFLDWLSNCTGPIVLIGQNPTADRDMIEFACKRNGLHYPFDHRTLDLHSLCLSKMIETNFEIPKNKDNRNLTKVNSSAIQKFVNIPQEPKPHNALNGAIYEAETFSRLVFGKNLLEEFNEFKVPSYLNKN